MKSLLKFNLVFLPILAAALVVGCDRIVRSGDGGSQPVSDTETPAEVAS